MSGHLKFDADYNEDYILIREELWSHLIQQYGYDFQVKVPA